MSVHPVSVDGQVLIPMRDGVRLAADLYLPAGDGPFPVLLMRTPYGRATQAPIAIRAAQAGYAVVIQDTRGRWGSEGEFRPFVHEQADGYDTCAWLCEQPWSTGRIGTFGGSYVGLTQWQAALAGAPGLEAIAPAITASNYHHGWTYQGGAYELGFNVSWSAGLAHDVAARRDRDHGTNELDEALDRSDRLPGMLERIPLAGDDLFARTASWYDSDWLAHPTFDDFWRSIQAEGRYGELDLACFHTGGWYDIFLGGTMRNFAGMRTGAKTERARSRQWVLINPRDHYTYSSGMPMGNYDPGVRSTNGMIDLDGQMLAFFDHVLRDIENEFSSRPPVRIFVMGEDTWRDETEWPLARAVPTDYYLHSGGSANTRNGDGRLVIAPAAGEEPADRFRYNPLDPVPTVGGPLCGHPFHLNWGRKDQQDVELREDVLCYTSDELTAPLEVTGPISVTLFAASSAPDTGWTAKLVDVLPDGSANNIIDGIIRARYRRSMGEPELLTPGAVEEYTIDLTATSVVFGAGHRIRLEISSSNFPRFDRNPNHGGDIATATEADYRPADQTVYHSASSPSRITLPVVPR